MATNLIRPEWQNLDSTEFRLLLDERVGGPGQYDIRYAGPNTLYLPLARAPCKIKVTFSNGKIVKAESGPAFDSTEWELICEEIEESILSGPLKVGRAYSFSRLRVLGSWRGIHSGVQILPPPEDAPRAPVELADHPFILEFPIRVSDLDRITNQPTNTRAPSIVEQDVSLDSDKRCLWT